MKKIYMAPMEGVTDSIFRNTFREYYGGVDKYFTPFISPNDTKKFTTREYKDIDPEKNNIQTTVPQLITGKSEHFIWAMNEIYKLGFREINFNLGCPSGTVVAKKKGSGLLYYPEDLDALLYDVFEAKPSDLNISIKTRLGKLDPEEFYEILDIYNKYQISELTIHPRIQKDFYRERVRRDFFDYAVENTSLPLIYNGDLKSVNQVVDCLNQYPEIEGVMLGRGLIANPTLALACKNPKEEYAFDKKTFGDFHQRLLDSYVEVLSGQVPVLHRMKEFWVYWQENFSGSEKSIKTIKKAKSLAEYKGAVAQILSK
ncbi:MAG: tRNA-dihydrouridine synthase family protein [Pseudobutyrivibrio sp.]|nr:tRNA-dihydrouridine synthase family protein [Pseudobutyrivibrio sp.]